MSHGDIQYAEEPIKRLCSPIMARTVPGSR
jgi:hypothetical protein